MALNGGNSAFGEFPTSTSTSNKTYSSPFSNVDGRLSEIPEFNVQADAAGVPGTPQPKHRLVAADESVTHARGAAGKPAIYTGSAGGKHPEHKANFESHLRSITEASHEKRPMSLREGVVSRAKTLNTENLPATDESNGLDPDFKRHEGAWNSVYSNHLNAGHSHEDSRQAANLHLQNITKTVQPAKPATDSDDSAGIGKIVSGAEVSKGIDKINPHLTNPQSPAMQFAQREYHGNLLKKAVKSKLTQSATDGGDGSGVMRRHHVEGIKDLDRKPASQLADGQAAEDSLGPTGKKFTEHLHARTPDGKFEPSMFKRNPHVQKKEKEEAGEE